MFIKCIGGGSSDYTVTPYYFELDPQQNYNYDNEITLSSLQTNADYPLVVMSMGRGKNQITGTIVDIVGATYTTIEDPETEATTTTTNGMCHASYMLHTTSTSVTITFRYNVDRTLYLLVPQ